VYGHLERFSEALRDLTEALRVHPYHVDTLIRRGEVHLRMQNLTEAASDFNRAREVEPNHVDAMYYLSMLLRGKFKKVF